MFSEPEARDMIQMSTRARCSGYFPGEFWEDTIERIGVDERRYVPRQKKEVGQQDFVFSSFSPSHV
jgi:hypothetical protein